MFTTSSKTTLNSEQKGFQLCCHCKCARVVRYIHQRNSAVTLTSVGLLMLGPIIAALYIF